MPKEKGCTGCKRKFPASQLTKYQGGLLCPDCYPFKPRKPQSEIDREIMISQMPGFEKEINQLFGKKTSIN